MSFKKAYMWLIFAVLTEVLATSFMKASQYQIWGFVCMYAMLVFSYYFMALSLKKLSISVAYAIWEVLGVLCVVGIGIFYFNEILTPKQTIGIALSIGGIMLINIAELKNHKADSESPQE
ncbi:multidrug efflux SMR transporter [Helicobacter sp. MIT 05-5293]|uniref:DMT family transporter n=1 Tax=Helicobacter sp. MIT 05-5293 TaxID=1548149 RepID=UPI00051D7F6F|nr:multidrug efflux SMR transporter [Helicobacter sp. MIT 05-5293]TLD80085.1 multidrug efflux SMR transporter [Helicobacter sp. MIT 05-5293]